MLCLSLCVNCTRGQIYQYVIHVTAHASVYTLVLMSLDRYLAVVHPIRSLTIRTRRNAVVALVFLWTAVIAANAPMLPHFSVGTTPVSGRIFSRGVGLAIVDAFAKFKERSFILSRNIKGGLKF